MFLFYITYLVSVSSLPIRLLPERNVDQSLVGLGTYTVTLPTYWLTGDNIQSGDLLQHEDDICGANGKLAMPKTAAEIAAITAMLKAITDSGAPAVNTQTWGGRYAWLGGYKDDGSGNTFGWLDGGDVTATNWDTNEPGTTGDGSGDPPPQSYQPFMGLVREAGASQGKWHDFHGQDQGLGGQEETVGQPAVCQSFPIQYWVSDGGVPTLYSADDDWQSNNLFPNTDICGEGGELAMPKTSAEQTRVSEVLPSLPTDTSTAWNGNYVWLGGFYYGSTDGWTWLDGTPVFDDSDCDCENWDTNEPGTSGDDESSLSYQPFLGMKRSNAKFHDFHGKDQGSGGKESSVGQLALCQGHPKYWTVGPVKSSSLCSVVPCAADWIDPCASTGGRMAMPKTNDDWEDARDLAELLPSGGAWGGSFLWLGGGCDSSSNWVWFDGDAIANDDDHWDTNEPGTSSSNPQPYFGMKRENGKWHDFHGNGPESNPGQYALCQY